MEGEPEGWYPSPNDGTERWLRWWDGTSWTEHTRLASTSERESLAGTWPEANYRKELEENRAKAMADRKPGTNEPPKNAERPSAEPADQAASDRTSEPDADRRISDSASTVPKHLATVREAFGTTGEQQPSSDNEDRQRHIRIAGGAAGIVLSILFLAWIIPGCDIPGIDLQGEGGGALADRSTCREFEAVSDSTREAYFRSEGFTGSDAALAVEAMTSICDTAGAANMPVSSIGSMRQSIQHCMQESYTTDPTSCLRAFRGY